MGRCVFWIDVQLDVVQDVMPCKNDTYDNSSHNISSTYNHRIPKAYGVKQHSRPTNLPTPNGPQS